MPGSNDPVSQNVAERALPASHEIPPGTDSPYPDISVILPCGVPAKKILTTQLESKDHALHEITIEPLRVSGPADPEFQLLRRLEQLAWAKPGIFVSSDEVAHRVFGDAESQSRPNPVLVCRIQGRIEGAIFTSIVHSEGLTDFPQRYTDVAQTHDPEGDTLLDYSVITNPDSQVAKGLRLFDPLVKSTATLAQELGLKHVVAYSRGEFFLGHIRFNPEFDKYDTGDSQATLDAIVEDLRQKTPNPNFYDLVRAFSFELPEHKLVEASELYPRWTRSAASPSPEILAEYFSLNRWNPDSPSFNFKSEKEAFCDFADFHFKNVGDRFQGPNHERLGAKYIGSIFGSRPDDIRSAFSNVMMLYSLPQVGE